MLTKPAAVFIQLLSLGLICLGILIIIVIPGDQGLDIAAGVVLFTIAVLGFWWARKSLLQKK